MRAAALKRLLFATPAATLRPGPRLCAACTRRPRGARACAGTPTMEDGDVMEVSDWSLYDPAAAGVSVDGSAAGRVLPHLRYGARGAPRARAEARSADGRARVQVLSPRLVRVELDPRRRFEDRPSVCFAFRADAPGGRFEARPVGDRALVVRTDWMEVVVDPDEGDAAVAATLLHPAGSDAQTRGVRKVFRGTRDGVALDDGDLLGTCRTLDGADGYARRDWDSGRRRRDVYLGRGLLSRAAGLTFLDDTSRPLFDSDGWVAPREKSEGYVDCYVLASGTDYAGALTAFTEAAGAIPMIPRRYLGNWWSRYYAYTQQELSDLMVMFEKYRVPLSMCIIDMDWHLVKHEDGVAETSDGWTGYTWNNKLFPDPAAFIQWLHDRNMGTALNLHPAAGVHSHEAKYKEFGEYIGAVARKTGDPIPFDLTDPMSASAYFKCLIHPLEEQGGELSKWSWWLDWQQGASSRLPGVDPLFLLNHLHYLDMARDPGTQRRPVIFSRYAGPGSHRTPIGFSGDTFATWESLAFQPYMTQTAANAAFPYWSHDIGGHTRGIHDDALYVRWVQFGVLSPIMRLHSTNNPFIERMPWSYSAEACDAACSALRMRHAFVPYIYSCNYQTFKNCEPLVKPMYYSHPKDDNAYAAPAQYWFGSQLVVAPFVSAPDPDTQLSRQAVWLPPVASDDVAADSAWRHLFTGEAYSEGWHTIYGELDDIPIFAPAGAIIPMACAPSSDAKTADFNSVSNPGTICLHVVAGGHGEFELYEDEETGEGRGFVSSISSWYESGVMQVDISPPRLVESKDALTSRTTVVGDLPFATTEQIKGTIPEKRTWKIRVVGVEPNLEADVSGGDGGADTTPVWTRSVTGVYNDKSESMTFTVPDCLSTESLSLSFSCADIDEHTLSARDRTEENVKHMISYFKLGTERKWDLLKALPQILEDPSHLLSMEPSEEVKDPTGTTFTITPGMKLALLETIDKCGFVRNYLSRSRAPAVVWNGVRSDVSVGAKLPGDQNVLSVPLSDDSSQIFYAVGTSESELPKESKDKTHVAERVFIKFGDVVSVELEMRDPEDDIGHPAVLVSS